MNGLYLDMALFKFSIPLDSLTHINCATQAKAKQQ